MDRLVTLMLVVAHCLGLIGCQSQIIETGSSVQYNEHHEQKENPDLRLLRCHMKINKTSSSYLKNAIEVYRPNFVRIELRFRYSNNNNHTSKEPYILNPSTSHVTDTVRPYHWVWTYYSPDGYFPYLKWPRDFPLLSFGLLDAKTLKTNQFLIVEVNDPNCSVIMGNIHTTYSIAHALGNFTRDYLYNISKAFSYSYWCYMAVIPGVKDTWSYQFGIYFAFPVEFARYNCCRTQITKSDTKNTRFSIHCMDHQVKKMWQGSIVPFVLGLVTFGVFPIAIFSASARLMLIGKKEENFQMMDLSAEDNTSTADFDEDWIFLNDTSPISLTSLLGGMCGLVNKYPIGVSRVRRIVFVLCGPFIIFCQLYMYYKYQLDNTLSLIEHGCPMGYLSMLAGYEKSKDIFLPILGGPFVLIILFYVAGLLFLLPPSNPDKIIFDGTFRYSTFGEISPLFLNIETIESYSHVSISKEICGYRRTVDLNKAMFYTIVNPKFWYAMVCMQVSRFVTLFKMCTSRLIKVAICSLLLPVYVCLCLFELALCVLYFGIPIVNAICIIVTGYILWMLRFLRTKRNTSDSLFWVMFNNFAIKCSLAFIVTCLFIYFVFSFCTIFIVSFSFVAEVFVFSFISVIIYPSTSFGYLFFGLIFLYYIFKMCQSFGTGYIELLADAVEVSSQLENDMYRHQLIDGAVIIEDSIAVHVTKLQIRDKIINLSSDQRQAIRDTCTNARMPKVLYRKHVAGIPSDLFQILVKKYLPVHIQITHAMLKIFLILALIYVMISVVEDRSRGPSEGISEIMHVIFIVAIGALPRVLEVVLENINFQIRKEIHLRKIRSTITEYWSNKS